MCEPAPIVDWSLIIGDCLHNTRTALDHLFWALVIKKNPAGGIKKASAANFPILKDASTFNGRKKDLNDWIGPRATAMLEKLQPFNDARGWNKNPLMFLHDFDITDKHKLLLPAISIVESVRIRPTTVDNRKVKFSGHASLLTFEDGAEVARFIAHTPEDVVDMNISMTFDVIFEGQPGPMRVVPTLERLIEVVESVGTDLSVLL